MTPETFQRVLNAVKAAGYEDDIEWAENLKAPTCPSDFAQEVIFVICNSGMKFTVARGIYDRVMPEVMETGKCDRVFGHRMKAAAIAHIWSHRGPLWMGYIEAKDKLAYLRTLPWIGDITKYHLAKNFGLPLAKPDVHLQRLAKTFSTTPQALCEDLAKASGFKVATVDTILWRAAALGVLDTKSGALR